MPAVPCAAWKYLNTQQNSGTQTLMLASGFIPWFRLIYLFSFFTWYQGTNSVRPLSRMGVRRTRLTGACRVTPGSLGSGFPRRLTPALPRRWPGNRRCRHLCTSLPVGTTGVPGGREKIFFCSHPRSCGGNRERKPPYWIFPKVAPAPLRPPAGHAARSRGPGARRETAGKRRKVLAGMRQTSVIPRSLVPPGLWR